MKKLLLLLSFCLLAGVNASAYDAKINGIYYNFSEDKATVTYLSSSSSSNYRAYIGAVVIPQSVYYGGKTYSVDSIGNHAFYGCGSLTSVTIPNSMVSIGEFAFSRCRSLVSIIIPEGVKSICDGAFFNCESLTSVILPNSVTTIEGSTFYECSKFNYYSRERDKHRELCIQWLHQFNFYYHSRECDKYRNRSLLLLQWLDICHHP